jgi:CheY-like chemotaxis protein/two-component sensor histidine kinase
LQNLSHEIRTPLNAIVGFSDLLGSSNSLEISEDIRHYTSIIRRSSSQLLSIVNDILTMSSIQTGQEKVVNDPFDIHKLFSDLEDIYTLRTSDKQIELRVIKENPEKLYYIITDGTKLTQILTNLLDNAVKYTHEGFIEVKYKVKQKYIEFTVKDTGIGIAKEAHQYIFERFRQAEQSIHAKYGGTGLGLSISYSFAQMLGGTIWVESEPGAGSIFYVHIPYVPFKETINVKKEKVVKNNISSTTILVAEDEINNFLLIKAILEEINIHKLVHARDGYEAVQMFENNHDIDLVLMDIKMPAMDGITAFKEIQKMRKDIPVIAQTAYALEKDEREFLNMGFTDYISKPIKREELISKVNKAVLSMA